MIGTATLDGLLLRQGVTVVSMGAGVVEIRERRPVGFTEWIGSDSSCADVPALFIAAGMTRVRDVIRTGSGRIIAEFREIPAAAYTHVTRLAAEWRKRGGAYVTAVGRPGESLCGLRVGGDRCGILAASGSNGLAAIRETGIEVTVSTCAAVHPRERLAMIESIRSQKWQRAGGVYSA
jgi:repressor of nif and glnA expression